MLLSREMFKFLAKLVDEKLMKILKVQIKYYISAKFKEIHNHPISY